MAEVLETVRFVRKIEDGREAEFRLAHRHLQAAELMSQLRKSSRMASQSSSRLGQSGGQSVRETRPSQRPDTARSGRPWLIQLTSKPFRSSSSVQVALRLLNARMPEHEDDANVDTVHQQPTGALVPEVVPPQVDASQLFLVPFHSLLARPRLDAVRQELQRFPGRLNRRLVGSVGAPEDECVGTQRGAPLEDGARNRSNTRWIEASSTSSA